MTALDMTRKEIEATNERQRPLTLAELGLRIGIGEGRLRRLFTRGVLQEPRERFMGRRVFYEQDVQALRMQLAQRGLLPART